MKNNKIITTSLLITILLLSSCTSKNSSSELNQYIVSEETESTINTEQPEKTEPNTQEWKDIIINPREIRGINFEKIHEDIEETERYQVKIKIPSTWIGERGYYNNNVHITFEGCGMLFRTTDDFILDKNVRDLYTMKDFKNWEVLEGTTKEGYSYIQYKYPDSPSYYFFVQVSKEFIVDFKVNLDTDDIKVLQTILDSINFSQIDGI